MKATTKSRFPGYFCVFLYGLFATGYAQAAQDDGCVIFTAKKIITMDKGWPEGKAVAVKDGRVLGVGSMKDVEPWKKAYGCETNNTFRHNYLMPGFVEAHGHPFIGGTSLTRPSLSYFDLPRPYDDKPIEGLKNKDVVMEQLQTYVDNAPAGETVLAWGYDVVALGGKYLDKGELDEISKDKPILVWDASEHFVFANSTAMTKYGITRQSTQVNGVQAGDDGEPNGQFLGTTAANLILAEPMLELAQPDIALKNISYLMDLSRKNGITTTSELAHGLIDFKLEKQLYETYFNRPNAPMRCVVVTDGEAATLGKGADAQLFVKSLARNSTDKLMYNGVKFFADDSFLSFGMVMENPGYVDGRQGVFTTKPSEMVEKWRPWWEAGLQIQVHTNGNGGNRATVEALDQLMKIKPRFDHRFTLTHYGMSTPEMARKLARIGGIASVNPYYLYYRSELNAPYVGGDRAYTAARLKTLVDAGIPTSLHSDTPVAPPRPLEEAWIAVERKGQSGKVRGVHELISVDQALRMITIEAAFTLGVEDKVGSIQSGKFADFVVLKQNPYSLPKNMSLRDIEVLGTVVGGKVFPSSEIRENHFWKSPVCKGEGGCGVP